jgi:hypothetical protein
MDYKFKKLSGVNTINSINNNSNVLVEDNGEIVKISAKEIMTGGNTIIDSTLTQEGVAADAKAVGDRISSLSEEKDNLFDPFFAGGSYPSVNIPADLALNVCVEVPANSTGVTEVKVTRCGENLIDLAGLFTASHPNGTVSANGITATLRDGIMHVTGANNTSDSIYAFRIRGIGGAYAIPPGAYTIPDRLTMAFGTNPDGSGAKNYSGKQTFNQPMYLSSFYCAIPGNATVDFEIPMVLLFGGAVADAYTEYSGDSYAVTLSQPCYGGTVNITNGKVMHTHALSSETHEAYPLDTPAIVFEEAEYVPSIKGFNFLYSFQGAITVNGCANRLGGSASMDVGSTPEAHGAAGNGVTDDTAAIQAAIDSGISLRFAGKYAIYGAITIPEGYLLDLGGCGVTMYDSGCFVVSKNAKLINARITYGGYGSAITIAGSHAMVLGCSVYGANGQGYGVSATSENGMAFVVVRDCVFSYLSCGFYSNDANYRNAFVLDFTATHCRQAINGSISGSRITICGQSATLELNNNEVYQMCIYGKLNTITDKMYDININDGTHCNMGLYVEGDYNVIDSFEANTRAVCENHGIDNTVINHNSGDSGLGNTYTCSAPNNIDKVISADNITVNTEMTNADTEFVNEILNVILNPLENIAIITPPEGSKIVLEIATLITRLDYLCLSFGVYYKGLRKVMVTLISDSAEYDDIVIDQHNICRTTMIYGNGATRALSGKGYSKMRLEFEFSGDTVDFIGLSGLIR